MPDAKTTSAMLTAPLLASTARTRQSGRTWLVAAAAACAVLLPLLFLAKRRAAQTLLNLDAALFSGDELTTSCHVVAELPESPVHINAAAVHEFARKIDIKSAVAGPPQDASAPQDDERTAALLVAWNAINFSYYPDDGVARWFWRDRDGVDHGKDDEANGVVAALVHANSGSNPALASAAFLQGVTADVLRNDILKAGPGAGELPLLEERAAALRELGEGLSRLGCTPLGLVRRAEGSAARLVTLLTTEFPRYADVQTLNGERLPFNKRAQLCASMLNAANVAGGFRDMHTLTVFADYRLPQLARAEGIFELDNTLATRIDDGAPIAPGSSEEVHLRAATIRFGEILGDAVRARPGGGGVTQAKLDYYLWRLAVQRDEAGTLPPFHRCRCTAY